MTINYTIVHEQLINASFGSALNTIYYDFWGPWWIILIFLAAIIVSHISSRQAATVLLALLGTAFLTKYALAGVEMHPFIYLICAVELAILLYRIFGKPD